MDKKELADEMVYALLQTLKNHAINFLLDGLVLKPLSKSIAAMMQPSPYKGASALASARLLAKKTVDGAILDGPTETGYAKYAIRKGMPGPGQKRLAIENEPHTVDDFNGVIEEGYGKGKKELIYTGQAAIKVGEERFLGKVNIHKHTADKAGLHWDFVAEGVKPGTQQFEVNIPTGQCKGRYAFIQTAKGMLVTQLKDRSVLIEKPTFHLKNEDLLRELDQNPNGTIAEWKPDGSLANVAISGQRAIFRSHRDTGEPYYDRLPGLEDVANHSGFLSNRLLFPGPDLDGTVMRGELFHPEGAARVGGILNSMPDKAIQFQTEHGPVTFIVWDELKHNGKDISKLPYVERRAIYVADVNSIRHFNGLWSYVPARTRAFLSFYRGIVNDPRGLPYAEGIVLKDGNSPAGEPWRKVKFRDTVDVEIVDVLEGTGKYQGSAGKLLVQTAGGGRGEVGSFAMPDWQRKQIFVDADKVKGQVIEIHAQEITKAGAPRAGVMLRFHPSKSEYAFDLESKAIADVDGRTPNEVKYAMKTAAGWKPK